MIEVDSGHPNAGADGHNLKGNVLVDSWWILDRFFKIFKDVLDMFSLLLYMCDMCDLLIYVDILFSFTVIFSFQPC